MKKAGFLALALGLTAPWLIGASSCSSKGRSGERSGAPQVEFIVTGSAPNGVHITYGNDASNYRTRSLPFHVTRSIKKNVLYWVMAQLQGGGRITCQVLLGDT